MKRMWRNVGLLWALACLAAFATLVPALYARPRAQASAEMQVALPRFVQVVMAAGDRFLAADLAGFRALVVSTDRMTAESYQVLGLVQSDVAWLNPAHEDNYYIAAAILPWNGEIEAAQYILKQATFARPFDWQPPFYYGANASLYLKNAAEGTKWMRIAADNAQDEMEKMQLQDLAAHVASKGDDIEQSISLLRMMAKGTRNKSFARFLEKRIERMENLLRIRLAIASYKELFAKQPLQLKDLVDHSFLPSIPIDPFGMQYRIDSRDKPQVFDPALAPQPTDRTTP